MLLRAVPSPSTSIACCFAPGAARLSAVAHSREPTTAPSAPSTRAAARVRPSTAGGEQQGFGRTTAQPVRQLGHVKLIVARLLSELAPWPPASPPCAMIDRGSGFQRHGHLLHSLHLEQQFRAGLRDPLRIGPRVPKGKHDGARTPLQYPIERGGVLVEFLHNKLQPTRPVLPACSWASAYSRWVHGNSPYPPPTSPSAPACAQAAARAPPDASAIGARAMGVERPKRRLKREARLRFMALLCGSGR